MSQFIYQQKQAWASLKKNPGFVATVLATMGTTLGALLCILTLAYVLIAKPLPYPDQENLHLVVHHIGDSKGETNASSYTYPGLIHLYKNQTVYDESALIYYDQDVLTSVPSQPTLNTLYVTPKWFSLLNAQVHLGRTFEATEALDTNNPVAILSFNTWVDEFGSDTNILNEKVTFKGVSFNVVGVLKQSFIEPALSTIGLKSQVILPWDYNGMSERGRGSWGNINSNQKFIGKVKSALTLEQISQTLTPLVNDTWKEKVAGMAFFNGWNIEMKAVPFKKQILGDSTNTVYLLLAGVIGLVLIACANISNLFMSRTAEQQRQLSIHAAVGATKGKLFKAILSETGLLMCFSVVIALIIATVGFLVMQEFLSQRLPRVDELMINWVTLASAIAISLLFALFFAGLSSRMINYRALNLTLQSSGKGTGIQVSKNIRKFLIVSQVAVVTSLVFVNISLLKDSVKTINQDIGFHTDNLMYTTFSSAGATRPERDLRKQLMNEVREKLTALPQVEQVVQASSPLNGFNLWATTVVATNERLTPEVKHIDQNYFKMIGQNLIEGDLFTTADIKDENRVAIVNEAFANRISPSESVIGKQVSFGDEEHTTIIGIVKAVHIPGDINEPILRAYVPTSLAENAMILKLKPESVVSREQVVSVLQSVTSQYNIFEMESLDTQKAQLLFTQYTTAITSAVLAVITFFLATIGLYGILSYSTQMRRFEIGTRLAIGAKRFDLISLIINDNLSSIILGMILSLFVLVGLYLGFSEAFAAYINLSLLTLFVITVVLISLISLFACYWPLRPFINRPAIHSLRGSE
ncbi:hypothetical protein CJF42_22745 [Pseudoalteromonas sp. NBT06-2]|uniref:ABC transporter permease n=1 Tax=Pseudoalteromonas sp. NBT06-2 TaxID=2025950 RepID=UPI000BA4FDEF|nr:ABC transporter permease [Pseudoalteromonas sp. NBT06-2]PAJ72154.1 hypothetical protein CJF42_22745 [Pseudoalteromonas sp. NBT06-2]